MKCDRCKEDGCCWDMNWLSEKLIKPEFGYRARWKDYRFIFCDDCLPVVALTKKDLTTAKPDVIVVK